jgi:YfiR/HmsC-like
VILARALAYDNGMAARAGGRVVLAIVFKKGETASEGQANDALKAFRALEGIKIVGLPFHVLSTAYTGPSALETLIDRDGVDAFLLCDGLSAEIPAVRQLGRKRKVLTAGGSEADVRAGLSMAVVSDENRLQLVLNLEETRKQGAAFASDLLRVARVIKE